MIDNRTIHLVDIPTGGNKGSIWHRLHGEREEICAALLKQSNATSQECQQQKLFQARLRKIDDALDRLMSGSYGICSNCGHSIENSTLEVDPAWALCLDCWNRESSAGRAGRKENETHDDGLHSKVILETLNSFDTILLHTHNNDYRILLLDPGTGRALVEGGTYLLEPSEGLVKGSALPGSVFNGGAICVGGRLEMWVNDQAILTSPIKSIETKHNAAAESLESISEALH